MHVNVEEKWPVLGRHGRAAEWLGIWTNLGRAPRTIDAYACGLAEYLLVCERDAVDPPAAPRLRCSCGSWRPDRTAAG
jgi:integrase/recombinase XerD